MSKASNVINTFLTVLRSIKQAIVDMGVTVPVKAPLNTWPDLIRSIEGGGSVEDPPQLRTPSLSRSNDTVMINNPSTNGNFAEKFRLYNGNTLLQEFNSATSFSLIGLGVGNYELTVTAVGSGFIESERSNKIRASVYSITQTLENLSTSNNAVKISNGLTYTTTLTATNGKYLPEDIVVTMGGVACTYDYDSYTGAITINGVKGNIVIEAVAYGALKLRRPTLSISGTTLTVTPPRYAEVTRTYINGELAYTYPEE
ncbi:MAG: hypothetical protein VZQ55_05535 [Ruminococcus sp.]|nr:hypothetical protein [Ruminococcus sp.]